MDRIIKPMEGKNLSSSLDMVENVFSLCVSPEEGKTVRSLVEEIRSKKYYIPQLEFIMTNGNDEIIGYVMFSRFHIEERYENELLILTPAAVRADMQRRHISKELIEYGFEKAREMGFKAVLVEGDPKNYVSRGFEPSYKFGIEAGANIHLPHPDCLMIKELETDGAKEMHGFVDYSFYKALSE